MLSEMLGSAKRATMTSLKSKRATRNCNSRNQKDSKSVDPRLSQMIPLRLPVEEAARKDAMTTGKGTSRARASKNKKRGRIETRSRKMSIQTDLHSSPGSTSPTAASRKNRKRRAKLGKLVCRMGGLMTDLITTKSKEYPGGIEKRKNPRGKENRKKLISRGGGFHYA